MKIALLGCGVVGSEVLRIIDILHATTYRDIEITKILEKRVLCESRIINNFDEILFDDTIDTVVEVMGGLHPAYEFICASLKAKKNVVSANKAVIAKYFKEFNELALENNASFMIEASVGGGIPWIQELQRILRMDKISSFSGIMNGTTNYILDNMHKNEVDFDEVLKKAQQLGYAESDPTADIEGFDIRNKVAITASIAYKGYLDVDKIPTIGISKIKKVDIDYFKKHGFTCKLLGKSNDYGNHISLFVCPTLTKQIEGHVESNLNITSCTSNYLGRVQLIGQGAGGAPTASAIVSDILDIYENSSSQFNLEKELIINNSELYHFYIRCNQDDFNEELTISFEFDDNYVYIKTKQMTINEILDIYQNKDCFIAIY